MAATIEQELKSIGISPKLRETVTQFAVANVHSSFEARRGAADASPMMVVVTRGIIGASSVITLEWLNELPKVDHEGAQRMVDRCWGEQVPGKTTPIMINWLAKLGVPNGPMVLESVALELPAASVEAASSAASVDAASVDAASDMLRSEFGMFSISDAMRYWIKELVVADLDLTPLPRRPLMCFVEWTRREDGNVVMKITRSEKPLSKSNQFEKYWRNASAGNTVPVIITWHDDRRGDDGDLGEVMIYRRPGYTRNYCAGCGSVSHATAACREK